MALDNCGGTYGGNKQPTHFLCLMLKMLQIQPDKDIIIEFIQNEDFKYVRILGAFYLRLVGKPLDIYKYLEPLYNDFRTIRMRGDSGYQKIHVDEFIQDLLTTNYACDIVLPHLPSRLTLENQGLLTKRVSALEDLGLINMDDLKEEVLKEFNASRAPPPQPAKEKVKKEKKDDNVSASDAITEESSESDDDEIGSSSWGGNPNSSFPPPEELFYKAARGGSRSKKQQPTAQRITIPQYFDQVENYTSDMLDNLSRQIRRHPSLAAKSYHYLNLGLATKIKHQWIRVVVATMLLASVVGVILCCPLPRLNHIETSPTGAAMESPSPTTFDSTFDLPVAVFNRTAFKESWTAFTEVGISNYLCGNYNFNPIMEAMMPPGDELKNVKIFGASVLSGVALFVLWLFSVRLAEREIILDSNIFTQILHAVLSIIAIPLTSMAFWAIFLLYFIQTILIGANTPTAAPSQEDTFQCISKLSSGVSELGTFAPIRELALGAVGLIMRVVAKCSNYPVAALTLHERGDLSVDTMKVISVLWNLVIGCTIYHLIKIIAGIYSVFRENKPGRSTKHHDDVKLMSLDLKFLPSFIPDVVTTENFLIMFMLATVSLLLWIFGTPIKFGNS
eukprot:gene8146-9562_t